MHKTVFQLDRSLLFLVITAITALAWPSDRVGATTLALPGSAQPIARDVPADDMLLLDGMRQRRLFDLAIRYVDGKLASSSLDDATRASLTVEQMKTFVTQAAFLPKEQRAEIWQSIKRISQSYFDQPDKPRAFLVRTQQALTHLTHATLLNQELAAEMIPITERDRGLAELRTASTLLDRLQADLGKAIPIRRSSALKPGQLDADELLSLGENVRYQLARCNLVRAQLYQYNSGKVGQPTQADRVDAFNQALQQLAAVVRSAPQGQSLWWKSRIAQLEAYRLANRIPESSDIVAELSRLEIPPQFNQPFQLQQLKLAILAGDRVSVQQLVANLGKRGHRSAELEIAVLESYLALAATSATANEQRRWTENASIQTKAIEAKHGGYWGRRAELALIKSVGNPVAGNPGDGSSGSNMSISAEIDLLVRTAADAIRKKRPADAVKAYDRAIDAASKEGNQALVQQLQIRCSQPLEAMANHRQAADRLLNAANLRPSADVAAAAHLRGCWNLAKVLATQQSAEQRNLVGAEFTAALEQHLELFSSADSFNQAAVWLAGQRQRANQPQRALEALLKVKVSSKLSPLANEQLRRIADSYLSRVPSDSERRKQALQLISQLSQGAEVASRSQSLQQRKLIAEELKILFVTGQADEVLGQQLIADGLVDPNPLQGQASILVASSISAGSLEQSVKLLENLATAELCDRLDRVLQAMLDSGRLSEAAQSNGRALQGKTIERALRLTSRDDQTGQTRRELRRAQWLISQRRFEPAIAALEQLESQFPDKAAIKVQLAQALTERALQLPASARQSALQESVDRWRTIAARTRSHSTTWFEAKYQVARLLIQQGDKPAAAKLLKFIKAIPPGWESATRKSDFEALLRQAESEN